jgi:hypothetical protein
MAEGAFDWTHLLVLENFEPPRFDNTSAPHAHVAIAKYERTAIVVSVVQMTGQMLPQIPTAAQLLQSSAE